MTGRNSRDYGVSSMRAGFVRLFMMLAVVCSAGVLAASAPGSASAQGYRSTDYDAPSRFRGERYDRLRAELRQYGRWVDHPMWGEVWQPDAGRSWRPYADGQWDFDPEGGGWTWVSNEDFGGIVYHYGRWDLDERRGWVWVPGNEWSPAWVMWRKGAGVIGWAPLPPDQRRFGDSSRRDDDGGPFDLAIADIWMFVDFEDFDSERVYRYALDREDNEDMLDETDPVFEIETERSGDYVGSTYTDGDRFAVYSMPIGRPRTTLRLFDNFDIVIRDYRRPRRIHRSDRRFIYRPIIRNRTVYIQSPERRRARANPAERRRFVRDGNRGREGRPAERRVRNFDRERRRDNAGGKARRSKQQRGNGERRIKAKPQRDKVTNTRRAAYPNAAARDAAQARAARKAASRDKANRVRKSVTRAAPVRTDKGASSRKSNAKAGQRRANAGNEARSRPNGQRAGERTGQKRNGERSGNRKRDGRGERGKKGNRQ